MSFTDSADVFSSLDTSTPFLIMSCRSAGSPEKYNQTLYEIKFYMHAQQIFTTLGQQDVIPTCLGFFKKEKSQTVWIIVS